jgi:hypothetical protein
MTSGFIANHREAVRLDDLSRYRSGAR